MNRLVIFTQNTMASTVATRQIIRAHHERISAIVITKQVKGERLTDQIKLGIQLVRKSSMSFMFYKIIESSGYNILLWFHKLLNSKRYREGTATGISELAKRYRIEVIRTNDLSNREFLQRVANIKPDYIFCIVGQLLKKNVFEILGNRLLNAHGSYLPEYRGPAQYFWYLMDGHSQFGVTLHYMNAGLDTGDIIFQQKFNFDGTISAYRVHYLLAEQFGLMFNTFVDRYAQAPVIPSMKQDNERATYTRMPTRDDVRKFKAAGHHLITASDFFSCL